METVESIKQKYIKFRGTEEKEYTRNFPKPPYVEKFYEKPLDPIIFAVLTARLLAIDEPSLGLAPELVLKEQPYAGSDASKALKGRRSAYFEETGGFTETPGV